MKKQIILDGSQMCSVQDVHIVLKEQLQFPDYYGENLDALYDCLTELEAEITIIHVDTMKQQLGSYFEKLSKVFYMAQEENPLLLIKEIQQE